VLKAQFDAGFGEKTAPFTSHTIPGIIPCAEYDIGTNGIAYMDTDYQKTRWDADQPWNFGWVYRNDGVDVEKSKDNSGSPYSIGWIKKGEWLKYTIDIAKQGGYDFIFRVASLNGGGSLQLLLNDVVILPSLSVPKTNGWYTWDTVKAANINLPAGEHVLTLKFINAGFNINQIEVTPNHNGGIGGDEDPLPGDFILGQNYPNPFNPETTIDYQIGANNHALVPVDLSIYNMLGQKVATLVAEDQSEGSYQAKWNAAGFASNVYYYCLKIGDRIKTKKMVCLR
jgi:hypothetical protein